MEASQMPDYLGPQIDEVNLGTLSPGTNNINQPLHLYTDYTAKSWSQMLCTGDFFGELSLLPLATDWRHTRTISAVQNSLLYFLSRAKVERLSKRFPDLKHSLDEYKDDYTSMQSRSLAKGASRTYVISLPPNIHSMERC
jgi:CRP-like cAMP-binding protein